MNPMPQQPHLSQLFRFSLRELLLAVTFIAVGCAALKFAGDAWMIAISSFTLLLFMAAVVIVLVGRGPRQAQAIGFVACALIYGVILTFVPKLSNPGMFGGGNPGSQHPEFDPYEGNLPTTKLLFPLFQTIVTNSYIDGTTGKEIPDYNPATDSAAFAARGMFPPFHNESPMRGDFMTIGHLLWTLLLGLAGGRFAHFVYCRRHDNNE